MNASAHRWRSPFCRLVHTRRLSNRAIFMLAAAALVTSAVGLATQIGIVGAALSAAGWTAVLVASGLWSVRAHRRLARLESAGERAKISCDAAALALVRHASTGRLVQLNHERVVTVIGRGHSGTRAIAEVLQASGVFMGLPQNRASDLLPRTFIVAASRLVARHVRYLGNMTWDFSALHQGAIDPLFPKLLEVYLSSLLAGDSCYRGWKLPETTLVYPWLVRCLPDVKYIFWTRDPRDNILAPHDTDHLSEYGVPGETWPETLQCRAASWKYQYDIVQTTPRPNNFLHVRLEDFVLQPRQTLDRLERFLGMSLRSVPVRRDRIGVWKNHAAQLDFPFLEAPLRELSYV